MASGTRRVMSAVFACSLAGIALSSVSGSAARAADDCIAEPKDPTHQGRHWYYHVDHVNHRKCWHQRAEGLTIQQVGSSKPSPSAKPILQQSVDVDRQQPAAHSHTEQPIVDAQPTTARLTGQSAPETSTDPAGGEKPPQSSRSSRWPDQRTSADLNVRKRGLARSAATDAESVIAVISSLNCGIDVLCLRAVEPDLRYYTEDACIAALNRLMAKAKHDTAHQLGWRCVPADSALPYDSRPSDR
jgi:hypothetical protein